MVWSRDYCGETIALRSEPTVSVLFTIKKDQSFSDEVKRAIEDPVLEKCLGV